MGRELLLGIDIGTSGCKIALFQHDGKVICSETVEYPLYCLKDGFIEQDPRDWWKAVCLGIQRLLGNNNINPSEIIGIGVDGQSWAAVAVDGDGEVLAQNPIWLDTRSASICNRLNQQVGTERIFEVSGNLLKPQYSTGKILWYKENIPEVYKRINKILQSNSYIVYLLTGVVSQDMSQGYGIHCFDMKKGRWDFQMCRSLGINPDILPDIYACHEVVGSVTRGAAASTGLLEGTPVVAGGLDAACATLGAGVIHDGQTQEQGGQAGGMSICMDKYCAEPRLILSFHVVPDRWLLQGGTTGGGGALRWFSEQFGYEELQKALQTGSSEFALLDELAGTVPAGSDGVVFLPYMAGERTPIWNDKAKGVFYGLDYSKTRAHMARAVMEGVAFSLRHNLEIASNAGANVETLRSVGGAANSSFWTQMKADITGKAIEVTATDTATTLGAAILAGVGVGLYRDFDDAVKQTVTVRRRYAPSDIDKEVYEKVYGIYLELYSSLEKLMNKGA
ncbi:MAG TPA: xylulokinase [Thermoclostridium caenicola]|uniref:xylulokinase n=1 Tax=Thermoclostridium caenicola TaxID=659425 RepID=UPI002BEBC7D0|nr:xylulokinase [Thermoclostridium caenicola]HOK42638.1 xylulokinase [Thermoclostridium caenicola]HOL84294.1 xylulokinase [Thermoclostridium caenicola]HPO75668.1 xylulokinase [Thermoclostridium caenicola]